MTGSQEACHTISKWPGDFTHIHRVHRQEKRENSTVWTNETCGRVAPKCALGKALHYLVEQWRYLIHYLEDGRLELSNNRAERSIKPFVMGRKNFLFANTPGSAQTSATVYSLIETARETDLNPYRYLRWVFEQAPVLAVSDEHWAEKLTPANEPGELKVPE